MTEPGFSHWYSPPVADSRRTLLLIHGPGGEEAALRLGAEIAPDDGFLSALVERRFPGDGFDRDRALRDRVEIASLLYGFDLTQAVAIGTSDQVGATVRLLMGTPVSAAALLHGAGLPPTGGRPDLAGRPVFIGAGEDDPLVSVEETLRLHRTLHRYGADVRIAWFSIEKGVPALEKHALATWLREIGRDGGVTEQASHGADPRLR